MVISFEQIKFFQENGYLIIDDFYSIQELDDFKEAYRKLILAYIKKAELETGKTISIKEGREFHEGMFWLEELNHRYIAEIYDCSAYIPEFLRIVSKRETVSIINKLLNLPIDSPLYTYTCRCRIDMPKDTRRTYGWHQEVFYTLPESDFLQTWAPMILDTTKENGTIEICPGSHKEGIAPQIWNEIPGRATQILVKEDVVQRYNPTVCEMKLGQLLIFSGHLFHQSGNNTSKDTRYSLVGMYHNATKEEFAPPRLDFNFPKMTPREYYEQAILAKQN